MYLSKCYNKMLKLCFKYRLVRNIETEHSIVVGLGNFFTQTCNIIQN